MVQPAASPKYTVHIEGSVTSSNVLVGENITNLTLQGDLIVNHTDKKPNVQKSSSPVFLGKPRQEVNILDREMEVGLVNDVLNPPASVEFYNTRGWGKSTLLRYLASKINRTDGMLFLSVQSQTLNDIFQEIFEAFFQSDLPYIPSQVQFRRYFENLNALILLDNITLTHDETQFLLDILPNCSLVFTSTERHLWDMGKQVALRGLPKEAAMSLFTQHLGRDLTKAETIFAEELCVAVHGNPLEITRMAALAREEGKALAEITSAAQTQPVEEVVTEKALQGLSESHERAIAMMASTGDVPIPANHLAKLIGTDQLDSIVKDLLEKSLVQTHSPSYSLTGMLSEFLNTNRDLNRDKITLFNYFVNWSGTAPSQELILDASDILVKALEIGASAQRWHEVARLGSAIEPAFMLGKRWGAWNKVLQILLQAGQKLGDKVLEAWVLHQLGSRALCLGDLSQARELLSRALEFRQSLGDQSGIAATQHNLNQITGGIPPRKPPSSGQGPKSGGRWIGPLVAAFTVIAAVSALILFTVLFPPNSPPSTITNTSTVTITKSAIPSQTNTSTNTPTKPPTKTPTATPTPPPILDITVDSSRNQQTIFLEQGDREDFFVIPLYVTIQNSGRTEAKISSLILGFDSSDGYHETEFRREKDPKYYNSLPLSSIPSGNNLSFEIRMAVPESYQGTSVKIIATLDSCKSRFKCNSISHDISIPIVVYDFIDNAFAAGWYGYDSHSKLYRLSLNGDINSSSGFAGLINNPVLEDGTNPYYVLETQPNWDSNGSITGDYDATGIKFEIGDVLIVKVGYLNSAGGEGVTFRVECGFEDYIFEQAEYYDGYVTEGKPIPVPDYFADGSCPDMQLDVEAGATADLDWAIWVTAYIARQ